MTAVRRKSIRGDYGRRLVSTVIDERAISNHPQPFASIPKSNDDSEGYQDVSYKMFANAINRCALWIKEQIGVSSEFETLVYIGVNDLRYQILCMAAVKTGHVMLLVAPSNSIDAHKHLFKETAANTLIISENAPPIVDKIFAAISIRSLIIPELKLLLSEETVEALPFTKTFDEYRMKPWIILHTSGSTGNPKPIVIRHGYPTAVDAHNSHGSEMARRMGKRRVFCAFPLFHMAGIMWCMSFTLFSDATIVLPSIAPLSAGVVEEALTSGRVDIATVPPSALTECCNHASFIEKAKKLKAVDTAGGPLSEVTGDLLSRHVTLYQEIGSTEMGAMPLLPPDEKDWQYFRFDVENGGIEFRPAGNDLFELVIVRKPHLDLMQAIFVTFPDLDEYATKDLYSKHPTKPGLWKYASRRDDIIIYDSGEKMNPVDMEGTISACPDVTGCIVVGRGRSESALLVEAKSSPSSQEQRQDLLEKIWPHVERANESAIAHGRVAKDRVLFTTTEKPLPRAGKGTIQRERGLTLYEKEIDELYNVSSKGRKSDGPAMDLHSHEATVESLRNYVAKKTGLDDIQADTDFFRAGIDSVQVIEMARTLNTSLDTTTIEPKQVYDNPTAEQLATIIQTAGPGPVYDSDSDDDIHLETWTQMQQMFHDFTADFPKAHIGRKQKLQLAIFEPRKMAGQHTPRKHRALTRMRSTSDDSDTLNDGQENIGSHDQKSEYQASSDQPFLISMKPPDGGTTAWVHVLASFLINVNMWGLVESFGVYLVYYRKTLLKDRSTTAISWIVSVQTALLLIVGVFSGALFDKGYFRSIVLVAGLGMAFAMMMLSLASTYYQIMLCQGVLLGFCSGLLYIPSLTLIPVYFKDRRGLAFGLATSGASIGGTVYPIILRKLLDEVGFAWATRTLGFITFGTLGLVFLITRPLPMTEKPSRQFVDLSAIKELPFLAFMLAGFLTFSAFLVPYVFIPTFAITSLKSSEKTGSYLFGVINAAQIFGQIGPAWLSDHIGGEVMLGAALFLDGILGFCWISVHNMGRYVCFLIFYGFFSGMIITLPPIVMPYVCPSLAVLGTRPGMAYAASGLGILIGPLIAVAAVGSSKTFVGAQLWVGCCIIVAAAIFSVTVVAAYRQRKMNDSKRQRVTSPAFLKDSGDSEK